MLYHYENTRILIPDYLHVNCRLQSTDINSKLYPDRRGIVSRFNSHTTIHFQYKIKSNPMLIKYHALGLTHSSSIVHNGFYTFIKFHDNSIL